MANPNRALAYYTNHKPTHQLVEAVRCDNAFDAQDKADEYKASKEYSRVRVNSRRLGARGAGSWQVHEVLLYKAI